MVQTAEVWTDSGPLYRWWFGEWKIIWVNKKVHWSGLWTVQHVCGKSRSGDLLVMVKGQSLPLIPTINLQYKAKSYRLWTRATFLQSKDQSNDKSWMKREEEKYCNSNNDVIIWVLDHFWKVQEKTHRIVYMVYITLQGCQSAEWGLNCLRRIHRI